MGLFGDLDVQSAADNPFDIPDGTYVCIINDVKVGPTKPKDGVTKIGMTLNYRIDEGEKEDSNISEWKHVPAPEDLESSNSDIKKAAERSMSFLKSRMIDLGIPADRINDLEPEDLLGIRCSVTVAKNGQYTNVKRVALIEESGGDPFK